MSLRDRSCRRCRTLLLVLAISLPVSPPAHAVMDDMFAVMFRMMLVMMNVMSDAMLNNNNNNWGNNLGGMNNFSLGMSAMPAMSGFGSPWNSFGGSPWNSFSPYGSSPWNNGWNNPGYGGYPAYGGSPWQGAYPGEPVSPAYWHDGPGTYPGALLEGRWIGMSGELLEIRGNRFRLRTPGATLGGSAEVHNNLLTLYSPQTNTVTRYTLPVISTN